MSQTFSKAWGLAAVRVGIAYANEEIINLYNKVKPPYNISLLNQREILNTLNDENQNFYENVNTILTEKKKLTKSLEKMRAIKKIFPSDANFVLVEVEQADVIYQKLVDQKVIIRNRNSVINNCLRITVGSPEENKKLIEALQNIQ